LTNKKVVYHRGSDATTFSLNQPVEYSSQIVLPHNERMIKVAIFDDNAARREGLGLLLDAMEGMECAGTYEDCRKVVERIKKFQPDVVLSETNSIT
jgi:hypothetical protein